jgi:predicted transcriptional regulator
MRNRTKFDIFAQILESASGNGGVTKTRLMYKAFLSSQQVKECANILVENGLLESFSQNRYKVTDKGIQFLKMYEEFRSYIKMFPEDIKQGVEDKVPVPSLDFEEIELH